MLRRKKSKADVVRERATDLWGDASEMAGKAADTIGPRLEEVRDELTPKVNAAVDRTKDELAPRVNAAIDRTREDIVPAVAEALGKTRLADTRLADTPLVEPPKKNKHRIRKLLILLGLGGAAAFAYKKFFADSAGSGGSYAPPAPVPTPPPNRPTAVPDESADTAPKHAAQGSAGATSDPSGTSSDASATATDADPMPGTPGDKLPNNGTTKIDPVNPS
ncbi:MAG: hypothetical protein ACRDO8_05615 [Nocardioidaceae bacterium]